MTILASDGLEYADITQRLLGNPLKNVRNNNILSFSTDFARYYARGFDAVCPEGDPGPSPRFLEAHRAGLSAAYHRAGLSAAYQRPGAATQR